MTISTINRPYGMILVENVLLQFSRIKVVQENAMGTILKQFPSNTKVVIIK